ncbi:MAG: VOC family protein [Pseudomonadota bacterium]
MQQPNPINVSRIDHVVLRVNDMERMVRFYSEVLGLRLERGPGNAGLAQLRAGSALIDLLDAESELGRRSGAEPDGKAPNMDHVCLQILPWDADAVRAHLSEHGVEPGAVEPRYGAGGTGPSMYLEDPEGNTVELKGG